MATMSGLPALLLSVSLAAAAGEPPRGPTLDVANRKVFTFRATVAGSSPAERLASAQARLEQLPTRGPPEQVEIRPVQLGSEKGTAVLDVPVHTLMTHEVSTCSLDDDVPSLMRTMTDQRIRHLPVVESGSLVGIVSIGDVVRHRVEELEVEARTLHDYIESGR